MKKTVKVALGIALFLGMSYIAYKLFGTLLQNSTNYKNLKKCPTEIQTIVNKYHINKNQIAGCQSKEFNLDEKTYAFVHIEYGDANDCSAGCFYSHYCAIVEDEIDYPYYSFFNDEQENILNILTLDTSSSKSILTGKNHALATTPEFMTFLKQEKQQSGSFRFCQ